VPMPRRLWHGSTETETKALSRLSRMGKRAVP
jgi:hypothetical protein